MADEAETFLRRWARLKTEQAKPKPAPEQEPRPGVSEPAVEREDQQAAVEDLPPIDELTAADGVQVLLAVVIMAILYSQGETAGKGVLAFGYRLGRERGEQTMRLAAQAVRSVALGVVVTALVQSLLAGVGLWASGIPHAALLTVICFVLGIAQLGPLLVLAPAVVWLYWSGHPGWGTALLIWSLPVIALDNVLRPILIKRGVELPMLLIIAGVIGGLIGFGVLGLFIGPVILAATYTLTQSWIAEGWPEEETTPARQRQSGASS